jgi:hypothetical protein
MNEATQLSLAKMIQESKILMADMTRMDPLARVWHEMHRERIGKEVIAAQAAATSMAASASTTYMPPPTSTEHIPLNKVPQVKADEEDVVEVQPPVMPYL